MKQLSQAVENTHFTYTRPATYQHIPAKNLRHPVAGIEHPLAVRAVGAAEKGLSTLHSVADYPTPAVRTRRCQFVDGALKAIKRVATLSNHDLESLIVLVVAG